jgi:nucleoside 2-deoxyribosyltransferase
MSEESEVASRTTQVFLNASLAGKGDRGRNAELVKHIRSRGFRCLYVPQEELPVGGKYTATQIKNANVEAIRKADVVVSVLDNPGLGVAFELSLALEIGKPVVLYRSSSQQDLGKMIEGVWEEFPPSRKAETIKGMLACLEHLAERNEEAAWSSRIRT